MKSEIMKIERGICAAGQALVINGKPRRRNEAQIIAEMYSPMSVMQTQIIGAINSAMKDNVISTIHSIVEQLSVQENNFVTGMFACHHDRGDQSDGSQTIQTKTDSR